MLSTNCAVYMCSNFMYVGVHTRGTILLKAGLCTTHKATAVPDTLDLLHRANVRTDQ